MKNKFTLFALSVMFAFNANAQCTTNLDFSTAIFFDPAFISGCSTSTSCAGTPTIFDNQAACEPTTAIDPCAPTPNCNNGTFGSDLWFKFYATGNTVTIRVNPGGGLIAGIQLLSGTTCPGLIALDCIAGTSPNATITLTTGGLTVGDLYYFRVYGTSNTASKRTGTFCFCGSSGLSNAPLAINLKSFSATGQNKNALIKWSIATGSDAKTFEVERSVDGTNFISAATINASGYDYNYVDQPQVSKIVLYRLKSTSINGHVEHSRIIPVNFTGRSSLTVYPTLVNGATMDVEATENINIKIVNSAGVVVAKQSLVQGHNHVDVSNFKNGLYYLQNTLTGEITKFVVSK
ncbi:hypothetical protein BH09BAC2_BH09BAC2_19890 [soil metagenome]